MNKFKRLLSSVCAVVMAASMLTACGNNDGEKEKLTTSKITVTTPAKEEIDFDKLVIPEKKLVIDGKEIDTTDLVVMTINDKYKVSFDEYRYFYFTALKDTGIDFEDYKDDKLEESYKLVKEYVEKSIKNYYANYVIAENHDIEVTSKMEDEIEVAHQQLVKEYEGEENFNKILLSEYYTLDLWKYLCRGELLLEEIYNQLYAEGGKYFKSKDDFKKFAKTDEYARVKHILIPYASQVELSEEEMKDYDKKSLSDKLSIREDAYAKLDDEAKKAVDAKAKKHAEDVLKLVNDGGDYDELLAEYNWDPGMESYEEGYFMTKDTSFVKEFVDASMALKVGEVSGLVESDYGYHIIKREAVDEKYVEENIDELYYDYYNETITATDSEMRGPILDEMKVTYFDGYEKLDVNSIS